MKNRPQITCSRIKTVFLLWPALTEAVVALALTNELDGYAQALSRSEGEKETYGEIWLHFMQSSQAMVSDLRMQNGALPK